MAPLLGCIADDFTGATDLCSMLVRGGMRTVQGSTRMMRARSIMRWEGKGTTTLKVGADSRRKRHRMRFGKTPSALEGRTTE